MLCDSESVYERFDAPLRRFVRSRIRDRAAAEDVLQDVYLRIHSRIHTVRDCAKLTSWLYQLARHAIVDHYRRQRPLAELPEDLPTPSDPCAQDALCELAEGLLPMIDDLPETHREALGLVVREGLTQAQVARRLGLSLSGAKSRVQRGRDELKRRLFACCHFELDRFGHVIDYRERCACCASRRSGGERDPGA